MVLYFRKRTERGYSERMIIMKNIYTSADQLI